MKLSRALIALGCLAVLASCQAGVIQSGATGAATSRLIALPAGARLQSATLYLTAVDTPDPATVNVHRITQGWEEANVSWESFHPTSPTDGYAPEVIGSFIVAGPGTYHADLTSLVLDWITNPSQNFGILLEQGATGLTHYPASEFGTELVPRLEIVFIPAGSSTPEVLNISSTEDVDDAYIKENDQAGTFGTAPDLYTGVIDAYQKHTLLRFSLVKGDDGTGTYTIGYWKTHAGFGPQADVVTEHLPIALGTAGGGGSITVDTAALAVAILNRTAFGGTSSNGISKLCAQLLGAKLNIAAGADGSAVATTIAAADAFLATHGVSSWSSLDKATQAMVLGWMTTLDAYNNGIIGPGHAE